MLRDNTENKVTVENLLKLKKHEKPSEDFWNKFESSFEQKRLNALLDRPSLFHRLTQGLLRFSLVGVPSVAAIAFVAYLGQTNSLVTDNNSSELVAEPSASELTVSPQLANTGSASGNQFLEKSNSRFVMDVMVNSQPATNFRKVLYNTSLPRSGAQDQMRYMDNSIRSSSSSNGLVKAGYNF